jgi:hypothetical protein
MNHVDRQALIVGFLMEEYRRIRYDHELDKRGIEEIGFERSLLIDLALHIAGHEKDSTALLDWADAFVTIVESMVQMQVPDDEVRSRIEEYVVEVLERRHNGND